MSYDPMKDTGSPPTYPNLPPAPAAQPSYQQLAPPQQNATARHYDDPTPTAPALSEQDPSTVSIAHLNVS